MKRNLSDTRLLFLHFIRPIVRNKKIRLRKKWSSHLFLFIFFPLDRHQWVSNSFCLPKADSDNFVTVTSGRFEWVNEISAVCKWERSLSFEKKFTQDVWQIITNCDSGVMVSIVAFQAVDRGSIPRCRNFFYNKQKRKGKEKDMSEVGFEPTPTFVDQKALSHCGSGRITSLSLAP